jgi:arylsulfatase A-like enzyme
VPLIVRWPGGAAAGACREAFVSGALDLALTLCQAAGAPTPKGFQGQSLLPLLAGEEADGRPDIYAVYHGNQFGLYSQRMVRDRRWKYVWNATAVDELYDLEADPGELHNRAVDPARASELERLRHRLVAWMEETGDRLLNGWTRAQLIEGRTG